jgi:hypothetical protein
MHLLRERAYLARSINNLRSKVLIPILDHSAERILDGGIVAFHKMAFDELDCHRRFTCTADISAKLRSDAVECLNSCLPTERLPTTAILRCFGLGILNTTQTVRATTPLL